MVNLYTSNKGLLVGSFLNKVECPTGTVSSPGFIFGSDLNSGFYWIGADNIALSLNGAKSVDLRTDATYFSHGKIGLDSTDYITWTDNTQIAFYVGGASRATLSTTSLTCSLFSATGSTGFIGNILYPYNNTFLTLKGRVTTSSSAQSVKVFAATATGVPTMGHQLLSYYYGNGEAQVGGVDCLDGFSFQRVGFKQTTDGTQQAFTGTGVVLTTTTDQIYQVKALVVGKQGSTNVAGVEIVATVRNVSGTASIVGNVQQVAPNQSAGDWGSAGVFATFTVSGADVRVSVQGKAATTIDWRMKMDYIT